VVTRVGILLVHGIGETKKFEIIEQVARNIAIVLKSEKDLTVRVVVNSSDNGARGASQQTWIADEVEPVIIEIRSHGKVTELAFSEAWWADVGKSDTLQTQVKFWAWGLSLWSRKQFFKSQFGTSEQMSHPLNVNSQDPQITISARLMYFIVSWIVLLIMPLLSLLSVFLRQVLGFDLRPDILVQYLGDIKHYQQQEGEGKKLVEDIGESPRIGVRRRVIKELVKMSLRNYDRWYIMAHSLGTVAAFNGLMETDAALPNYLGKDLWQKWQNHSTKKAASQLTNEQIQSMSPDRPIWLQNDDIIDRGDLFANLHGLLTYGSPLSKFAAVWPAIVTINKNNSIFLPSFEWINVYDPTDPVGGETKFFNLENFGGSQPIEIAYKAEGVHLLSHVEYMNYNPRRQTPLVKQVSTWLMEGKAFQPAPEKSWGWPDENQKKIYVGINYGIWIMLGWLIPLILGLFIKWQLPDSIQKMIMQNTSLEVSNPLLYISGSWVIVFITGITWRGIKEIKDWSSRVKSNEVEHAFRPEEYIHESISRRPEIENY
jgi:hypothetical protein